MTLLAQSFLPSKYWSFAFQTSVYLINLLPAKLLNFQSPLQVLFHKIPNYHHLRVFGCLCFPSLRPYNHHKLSYRSTACVFLGYASTHKGYICLDVSTSRLYISRDVLFHESSFPFQSIPAHSPLPQHTPLTSALINPPLLSTSSPSTVSFPVPISSTNCTSTSDSLLIRKRAFSYRQQVSLTLTVRPLRVNLGFRLCNMNIKLFFATTLGV